MKKNSSFKKSICILLSIIMMLMLSSCAKIELKSNDTYEKFLAEIQERTPKEVYGNLPNADEKQVKEKYLYYSEDPLDDEYIIYLKCSYTETQYNAEIQRINEVTAQWADMVERNTDAFDYDSLLLNSTFDFDKSGRGLMNYSYFLFEPENNEIVYMEIFTETRSVYEKLKNVPKKYLPKPVVSYMDNH